MVRCLGCGAFNPAEVSTCKQCGAQVARVCAQCGAGNPLMARFCCGCGGRIESSADSGEPPSFGTPEHRQLTVMFCDLVGSTQLSRALGPEEWHRLVHLVHSRWGEVVGRQHGHVAQYLGDGLLAYFGYPLAAHDDARRAVAAGLDIVVEAVKLAKEVNQPIRVRVGVHTGPVVVGNVGARRHQESLALGETPNLAARIQDSAPPDGVVVSANTHGLVKGFFDFSQLGAVTPKGFSEPLILYKVIDERGFSTPLEAASASGLTPLVGRNNEAIAMSEAWDLALAGRAPVLLLIGEAGIGKSRLVRVLEERLAPQGARIVDLRCSEHSRGSAFHPLIDSLQTEAGLGLGESSAERLEKLGRLLRPAGLSETQVALVASLFGVPIPPSQTPQALRPALIEALSAWLEGTKEAGPTVTVLEDLHWADPSTLELLAAWVNRAPATPILTVLTARPEFSPIWATGDRVRTLLPGRLDPQETRRMIELVAGGKPLPADIVDRLAARAEGIPLFLEEMTKTILESGILRETAVRYELDRPVRDSAIPATLRDSLTGRLDHLGPNKPVAQLASVLGREFTYGLFEAVWRRLPSMPGIDLATALDGVVAANLIVRRTDAPELTYQFKHSLLQDAAYQSLLRSAQHQYHRETAAALLESFPDQAELRPDLVAYHYAAAQMNDQAATFFHKAGQRSIASSAYAESISHFGAGLEHLRALASTPQRAHREIDLRVALGVALITTRGFAALEVEETYSRAAELCNELGSEVPLRVLYGVWAVNLVRSDLPSVQRMVPDLERVTGHPQNAESALVAHAALATWSFWRGDYPKLAAHYSAGRPLCDTREPKVQHERLLRDHGFEGVLYPQLYFAWSQGITGDIEAGLRTWREAEALGEAIGDPYVTAGVLAFGATLNHDIGCVSVASALSDRLRQIAQEKGLLFWLANALVVHGNAMVTENHPDAGIARIKEGLGLCVTLGARTPYSYYLTYLAEAYLATGRLDEALATLDEARQMARTNVDRNFEPEMLRLAGEVRLAQGQVGAAEESFREAVELSRAQGAKLFELRAATSLARAVRSEREQAKRSLQVVRDSFTGASDLPPLQAADALLTEP